MGRRRKQRTHVKQNTADSQSDGQPKSFIIKHGQVGHSLAILVRDLRKLMEPNTASRLKERTRNKLKDYLTLAPALHVTHILAFTLSSLAPYMRLIRLSSGPTLTFRLERYSLSKDILNTKKRARSMGLEYLTPPLLVLASFPAPSPTTPPHLTLLMKSFQSLFPPLSPHSLSLSAARRVVLVQYDPDRDTVDVRHYLITVKAYGVSRRVRKVLEGAAKSKSGSGSGMSNGNGRRKSNTSGLVDLGRERDVADFVLRRRHINNDSDSEDGEGNGEGRRGYETASTYSSESEGEGEDEAAVSLADDYVGRNNKRGSRRAVRLDEIGPRMELKLVKVVEGVPGKEGAVMWHRFVKKSKAEAAAQTRSHAEKEALRKARRAEQDRNVARKKALTENGTGVRFAEDVEDDGVEAGEGEEGGEEDEGIWDDEEEVSEGEESEAEAEESSEDERPIPPKKVRKKER